MKRADSQAEALSIGPWSLAVAEPWQRVPHVGAFRPFPLGLSVSVGFADDTIAADQPLAEYVADQMRILTGLLGAEHGEAVVEPLLHAPFEEATRVARRLVAYDGTELDVAQLYLRSGGQVAIATCTAARATVDYFADVVDGLLRHATVQLARDSAAGKPASCPAIAAPSRRPIGAPAR